MLVTISGIDGSGKTTIAEHVVQVLRAGGIDAHRVRFRRTVLGSRAQAPSAHVPGADGATLPPPRRWTGFRPRTLSAAAACGHIARVAAFRLFGPRLRSPGCHVFDRYFYDSFMHYELRTARERLYCAIIRRLIPRPDIAVLLVASPDTLRERAPGVAGEFLLLGAQRYDALPRHFPALVTIRTDAADRAPDRVAQLLRDRLVPHLAASAPEHLAI